MGEGTPRRRRPTLAERSARQGSGHAPTSPVRHCWVRDTEDAATRWPGLLLEWRREDDGRWQGRVAYAVTGDGQSVLVVAWTPQEALAARDPQEGL